MAAGRNLPSALGLPPTFAFAGRAHELATLRALVPRAEGEGRRAALVGGDPGSGKSRLVRELAREVADEGVVVLYGDCDSVVGLPYGPFAAALEHLLRTTDPDTLRRHLGAGAPELGRLLPELDAPDGSRPAAPSTDPDAERHRLHAAVTTLLVGVSSEAPLLLVLEDVHWADTPTLQLMRHLVRSGAAARMLLVVTYRDAEADMSAELTSALVDMHRTEGVVRIRLGGLAEAEVAEFLRLAAGAEPSAELVAAVGELTGGNAFLLTELWRELEGSGALAVDARGVRLARPAAELGVPTTVREVVGQRLAGLSREANEVLALAAVVGADFELETIRRAGVLRDAALLEAVQEAVAAGLLVGEQRRALAYRFAHELVRRAVTDGLPAARKAGIHLRVARALEKGRDEGRARLAALAHHYAAAAPLGGIERAVEYNLLAAESAVRAVAFAEAEDRFRTALDLGLRDPRERAGVMLRLGDACHRAGHADAALAAFSETAELARELGDPELLARAAVGFEEACWRPAIHDAGAVDLLEEAAGALSEADSELRALVLGGLARSLELRGEPRRAALARDESISMSRRRDDRRSLAATLAQSYWSRGSSSNEDVNRMLLEAKALGEELNDLELQVEALSWLVPSYVVLCDHDAAKACLDRLQVLGARLSEPFRLHVAEHYAAALALCDGDLEAAEAAAARSQEWGRLFTGRDASGTYGIQMFSIRREQGRLAELAPAVRLLEGDAGAGVWQPGLVALQAELGMAEQASQGLRRLLGGGLAPLGSSLWLASLLYLADACATLDDAAGAESLYPALAAYEGGNAMVGHLVACYGATDRYLGMTAAVLGDWERAERHFRSALALNARLGARTWLAHTAYWYARMLLARGSAEDRAEARAQLGVALHLARAIGLPALERRAVALGAGATPPPALPDGLSEREVEVLVQLARGRSNREIGRALHISEHTAANHIRSILRKTRCANRTEAAGYALRRGLVPVERP